MDYLTRFYDEFGIYGNTDKIYMESIIRIKDWLQKFIFDTKSMTSSELVITYPQHPPDYYILTKTTSLITIHCDKFKICEFPQMYNGYIIIDGIEKTVSIIDVLQPYTGSITRYSGNKIPGEYNIVSELKSTHLRFDHIIVGLDKKVFITINNLVGESQTRNKSKSKIGYIDLFFLLYLIDDSKDNDSIVNIIESFLTESINVKKYLDIPKLSYSKESADQYVNYYYANITLTNLKERVKAYYKTSAAKTKERLFYTICMMVANTVSINIINITPSSSILMKRFDSFGINVERNFFREFNTLKQKDKISISTFSTKVLSICTELISNLKTGKLKSRYGIDEEGGVQALSRKSTIDTISHIRKIKVLFDVSSKDNTSRCVDTKQYGFICPFETPESKEVGLTEYLACSALITNNLADVSKLFTFIDKYIKPNGTVLIVDNFYYGTVDVAIINDFIKLKSSDKSFRFCSISIMDLRLYIYTDEGRIVRPIIYEDRLLFIDYYEQNSMDKSKVRELHETFLYGIAALVSPLSNHNQATRISYQSSISKQAIECNPNILKSYLNNQTYLWLGEMPKCSTIMSKYLNIKSGINVNVAIMSMGNNQEDAIIMNKNSVEKGLFTTTKIKSTIIVIDTNVARFVDGRINSNVKVDNNGIIKEGQYINNKDYIAAVAENSSISGVSIERYYSQNHGTHYVHKVVYTENKNFISVCITTHYTNKVNIGDKFASRYSQKGVVSDLVYEWNLPYTLDGRVPDIIINAHAIPSRMTVGHLIETVLGLDDLEYNTTPFKFNIENISQELMLKSEVQMYNPEDGSPITNPIFFGQCYYQVSKHQVVDKFQSRYKGDISTISRQAVEGKSKGGGLRIGEMEKDSLVAYEAMYTIMEKFHKLVDSFTIYVCGDCNNTFNPNKRCDECKSTNLIPTSVPYSFKLIHQLLGGVGISTHTTTELDNDELDDDYGEFD